LEEERRSTAAQGAPKVKDRDWSLVLRGVVQSLPSPSVLHSLQDLVDEIGEILRKPSSAHESQVATGKYRPYSTWPALVLAKIEAMLRVLDGEAGDWVDEIRAGVEKVLPLVSGEKAHGGDVRVFDSNVAIQIHLLDSTMRLYWQILAGHERESTAAVLVSQFGHGGAVPLGAAARALKVKDIDAAEAILREGITGATIRFQKGRASTGPTFRIIWSPPS
jgi:hypothetical protein